jgi:hypothetical protein
MGSTTATLSTYIFSLSHERVMISSSTMSYMRLIICVYFRVLSQSRCSHINMNCRVWTSIRAWTLPLRLIGIFPTQISSKRYSLVH